MYIHRTVRLYYIYIIMYLRVSKSRTKMCKSRLLLRRSRDRSVPLHIAVYYTAWVFLFLTGNNIAGEITIYYYRRAREE